MAKIRRQWRQVADMGFNGRDGWGYGVLGPLRGDGVLRRIRVAWSANGYFKAWLRLGLSHGAVAGADALESAADLFGRTEVWPAAPSLGFPVHGLGYAFHTVDIAIERAVGGGSWYVQWGVWNTDVSFTVYGHLWAMVEGHEYLEVPLGVVVTEGGGDG